MARILDPSHPEIVAIKMAKLQRDRDALLRVIRSIAFEPKDTDSQNRIVYRVGPELQSEMVQAIQQAESEEQGYEHRVD